MTALLSAMIGLLVFPGLVLGASIVAIDMFTRGTPQLAKRAIEEVERECYGLTPAPELIARAAPQGYNPDWTTFAVRRSNEDRPGVGDDDLPSRWVTLDYVHPYEATASFNADGDVVSVTCRKIGPGTGNATADDLTQTPPDSNPLGPKTIGSQFHPRFFTLGVPGPSEEAKQLAKERAAEEKAKAKDEDAKGSRDAAAKDADAK